MPARALKPLANEGVHRRLKAGPKSKNAREGIETSNRLCSCEKGGKGPKSKNAREGIETRRPSAADLATMQGPKSKNAREGIETI